MTNPEEAKPDAWADPEIDRVRALVRRSADMGWREALRQIEEQAPFFVERMENLALGSWQLLLEPVEAPAVLDIGCGFGSLTLGSASFARFAAGIDALSERVLYGALRARQARLGNAAFVEGDGLGTPFRAGSFDIATLNGVLEWAGLYAAGDPRSLQLDMLEEARRLVGRGGRVCVAIENKLAAETLLGLRDTHTGTHFLTALPEPLSSFLLKVRTGEDPRVRLHSRSGYESLFGEAGLSRTRVFNLIPSYNDYRFVLEADDSASHRLVYGSFDPGDFYAPAGRLRRTLARRAPGVLSSVAYSYLVVGQQADSRTLLDPDFPAWETLDVPAGASRFGVQMGTPGAVGVVLHREGRAHALVKCWARGDEEPSIPDYVGRGFGAPLAEGGRSEFGNVELAHYRPRI